MLGKGQATGSASGALALGGREDTLNQLALAVAVGWEVCPHLGANAVELSGRLSPLGRDAAVGAQVLTDMVMLALAIELGVGYDQSNHPRLPRQIDDRT